MVSIASLVGSTGTHASHSHKGNSRNLAKAGQSLLAGATGLSGAGAKATGLTKRLSAGLKAIQNAVTAALQKSQESGSTTDPDQLIQNAIKQLFKSGLVSPGQASEGLSDDDSSKSTGTGASSTVPQTFAQVLQSFGVTAAQFRKDLANSIQQATSDTSDASNPAQSQASGSLLNLVA